MTPNAVAESGSLADPAGDAPERIDVTRLTVTNGDHWFTMRADVAELRQKGEFTFNYWRGASGGHLVASLLVVVDRVDGETRGRFYDCGWKDCVRAPCPRLEVKWRALKDFVWITAPQRCFPPPRTHPDAPPPAGGRFFVSGRIGDVYDSVDDAPLALERG
ncbi:hypothetical protein F0U44_16330 [Nocardioides humilatus]|uniref:Uncharacterized protein n=1 Tax=Nocardioides humilatus TaxID=2607660 RepID=A0A5B1L7U4_9ACTN|nr:hypothetical protein [Nocardioides humilatus]KAA1416763.1 hypothetical protein F0U44_16330 [Nocardioides humilatus]